MNLQSGRDGGGNAEGDGEGKEEAGSSVGTKEAATKAAKELETRLAKLGSSISKADAMAVAEKVIHDKRNNSKWDKSDENECVWWRLVTLTHEGIAWPPPVYSVNQLLAAKSTKKHCTTTKTAKTTKTAQSLTPSQCIELQNTHVIDSTWHI